MSIKIIRMCTGEELLADIKDEAVAKWYEDMNVPIKMEQPAIVVPQQQKNANGQMQTSLAIVPWVPYIEKDDGITINGATLIYIQTPCIDLVNVYSQQFGSGLVIPPSAGQKKKIITGPTLMTNEND